MKTDPSEDFFCLKLCMLGFMMQNLNVTAQLQIRCDSADIEDLTGVVIPYEIYETSLQLVS